MLKDSHLHMEYVFLHSVMYMVLLWFATYFSVKMTPPFSCYTKTFGYLWGKVCTLCVQSMFRKSVVMSRHLTADIFENVRMMALFSVLRILLRYSILGFIRTLFLMQTLLKSFHKGPPKVRTQVKLEIDLSSYWRLFW